MLKREIQVSVSKPIKDGAPQTDVPQMDFTDKAVFTQDAVVTVVKAVTKGVATYVVLDTFRRIAVAYASK